MARRGITQGASGDDGLGMVFGVAVPEVGASRGPANIELNLTSAVSDPAEDTLRP